MDQYLSGVIIAIITGVFSVVTILVQKRQDKEIAQLNDQTAFIDKENEARKKLQLKEKEREQLMYEVMILVLETNLLILKNTHDASEDDSKLFEQSAELRKRFIDLTDSIKDLSKEYDLVLEMTANFRKELTKLQGKDKK